MIIIHIFFSGFKGLEGLHSPFDHFLIIMYFHEKSGLCHQCCCFTSAWPNRIHSYFLGLKVRVPHLFINTPFVHFQDIKKILARCDKDVWKIMLKVTASSNHIWPRYSQKINVYCK